MGRLGNIGVCRRRHGSVVSRDECAEPVHCTDGWGGEVLSIDAVNGYPAARNRAAPVPIGLNFRKTGLDRIFFDVGGTPPWAWAEAGQSMSKLVVMTATAVNRNSERLEDS